MGVRAWGLAGSRKMATVLLLAGFGVSAGADAASDDDAVRAEADALLHRIARAGADAQPLDRARVEALSGLRTSEACGDFVDPQGHVYWCKSTALGPQTGPIRFLAYDTSRLGPGAMSGGTVTWEIDRKRFCLKGDTVRQALGVQAEYARQPVMADLLAFSDPEQANSLTSYDFTLLRRSGKGRLARYKDNYVAVVEQGGCVERFSLRTYTPVDG